MRLFKTNKVHYVWKKEPIMHFVVKISNYSLKITEYQKNNFTPKG